MWIVKEKILQMAEGDYGIQLPVTVNGTTLTAQDSLRFTFKTSVNEDPILVKEYSNPDHNTINLEFTESESELFKVGEYVYVLDWYQNGVFMCNLIPVGKFKVVDKA